MAFTTEDDLKKMFNIIDTTYSPEEFLNAYNEKLLLTPEDKQIPRNITSLYSHVELVGKIYRVLKKHVKIDRSNGEVSLKHNNVSIKTIFEAEGGNRTTGEQNVDKGKWQARFIKCYIKFPHSFVRLQDINLLVKQAEFIRSFVAAHQDYVMFYMPNFLSLFLPIEIDLREIFKELLTNCFFIEYVETIADLGILSSNLDKKILKARQENEQQRLSILNNRNTKVYKRILTPHDAGEDIQPHICDICQLQPAMERIKENIREWICDKCFSTREEGESFRYPDDWEDQKIVWLKFNLDQDKLENWLNIAFASYIDSLNSISHKQTLKDEFRSLACQSDFVKDYMKMITIFWERCKNLNIMKPISDYEEIGVCRYSGKLLNEIIEKFLAVHTDYFPNCEGDAHSPISLSLSIAHIKYPVREHWRYFENPRGFLNIRNHNVFEDSYTKKEIEWLNKKKSEAGKESAHFLYKLSSLYDRLDSEINIIVEILNNKDKHPAICNLYSKIEISPKKMLNFFRIIEERDEITKA